MSRTVLMSALALAFASTFAVAKDAADLVEQELVEAKRVFEAQPTADNERRLNDALFAFEQRQTKSVGGEVRATVAETEPNDTSGTADAIGLNTDRGMGDITPAADRDWWSTGPALNGDLIFVLFDSGASGTGTDTEMSVFESDGTTLIEFDDDSGDGLGSAVAAIAPASGTIFMELNEFGDNGTIEPYNLFVAILDPAFTVGESEPNDTTGTAQVLGALGLIVTGDFGDATDDVFAFEATAGDRIGIVANNDPDNNATNSDVELTLFDTDGSTVLASEAPFSVTSQNSVAATAANTGTHFITLSDGSGADTDYSLAIFVNDIIVPVELQTFDVE